MTNKAEIIKQLTDMNAPRDKIVLVHSSLRAVGDVEGRGEGLLQALVEYFTSDGGLLCIPTHTWANVGVKDKITLDLTSYETCIGTLPNIAASLAEVRTLHPTHSMAVFGDKQRANDFAMGEGLFETPADPRGCYGKIFDNDGYILLIGVGHNRNTYLHCVEEMLGVKNRIANDAKTVTVKHTNGTVETKLVHPHEAIGIGDVSLKYPKFEKAFRYYGAIVDGFIGEAKAQLCSARIMKDVTELIFRRSGGRELLANDEPLAEALYI